MHPGNADEKLRTEVATFIWIQENCPSIPIPFLWGLDFLVGKAYVPSYDLVECALTAVVCEIRKRFTRQNMLVPPTHCFFLLRPRCPPSISC